MRAESAHLRSYGNGGDWRGGGGGGAGGGRGGGAGGGGAGGGRIAGRPGSSGLKYGLSPAPAKALIKGPDLTTLTPSLLPSRAIADAK